MRIYFITGEVLQFIYSGVIYYPAFSHTATHWSATWNTTTLCQTATTLAQYSHSTPTPLLPHIHITSTTLSQPCCYTTTTLPQYYHKMPQSCCSTFTTVQQYCHNTPIALLLHNHNTCTIFRKNGKALMSQNHNLYHTIATTLPQHCCFIT